jgi:oligosaccharide repeat unit polymerase
VGEGGGVYDLILATFALALASLARWSAGRWSNPFPVFCLLWAGISLLHTLLPIGIVPTSGRAALIVGSGLLSMFLGFLAARAPRRLRPAAARLSRLRWTGAVVVVALGVGVGLLAYRSEIMSLSGRSFDQLTRQQVLYYQQFGDRPVGGKTLLLSLTVVLAALGVLGIGRRWGGLLVLGAAAAAAMQSPSRTLPITLLAAAYVFWLYTREPGSAPGAALVKRIRGHPKPVLVLAVVAVVGLAYFNAEGRALKKDEDSATRPLGSLTSPLLYATGSLSALSVAVTQDVSPTEGAHLRSVWLLPRVMAMLSPQVKVPETVAGFVDIPQPYNTYTMFGDVYFDFGLFGVCVMFMFFGFLVERMHRRADAVRSLGTSWISAILVAVMFGGVVTFRLFWLETLFWLLTGTLIMQRLEVRRAARDHRRVPE